MKISEIFYSIQGEGIAGRRAVGVRPHQRLQPALPWCDTPYTSWQPEGEEQPLGTILAKCRREWPTHVVITGGEPMLAKDIVLFTQRLKEILEVHITVETSGTVFEPVVCDLMSISPKLSNSTPTEAQAGLWSEQHEEMRYQPDVLKKLIGTYTHQLKFVVAKPQDIDEIKPILREIGADRRNVLLMPEGTDPATLAQRSMWIAEICKREKWRYSPRLHIELYGNKRGT